MRVSPAVLVSVVAAIALNCSDSTKPLMHIASNGGFESGTLSGWVVSDTGDGTFIVTGDTILPVSATQVPAPAEGQFAAVTDQGGPGRHILYQDIAIPAKARATFTATIYVINQHTDYVVAPTEGLAFDGLEANQQVRVDIMNPAAALDDVGSGVLLNVFRTVAGDSLLIGPRTISADLTAFAGQTIRIRFVEVDNQLFQQFGVDAVDVTAQ